MGDEQGLMVAFSNAPAPYRNGEFAEFSRKVAFKLVLAGAGVLVDPPPGFDQRGLALVPDEPADEETAQETPDGTENAGSEGGDADDGDTSGDEKEDPTKDAPEEILGYPLDTLDLNQREPVHVGGGQYQIAGIQIKGKKKALELAALLPVLE
jgi:hypothetical protein